MGHPLLNKNTHEGNPQAFRVPSLSVLGSRVGRNKWLSCIDLFDLNMPRVDGRRVRPGPAHQRSSPLCPIIILMSSQVPRDHHACLAAGATAGTFDGYLDADDREPDRRTWATVTTAVAKHGDAVIFRWPGGIFATRESSAKRE